MAKETKNPNQLLNFRSDSTVKQKFQKPEKRKTLPSGRIIPKKAKTPWGPNPKAFSNKITHVPPCSQHG